jgi:hypothetical protein
MAFCVMFDIKHQPRWLTTVQANALRPCFIMAARRLEDRIKELCARLLIEKEPNWSITAKQLQLALQQHVLRTNNLATAVLSRGSATAERRKD